MVRLEFDDGETSSPPNKRNIDRLSALPDCLLIHILSFLGVEEASVTTVLSKRWQFLWAELPSLGFLGCSNKKIRNYVAWINTTLATRSAKYLEKFQVHLSYDKNFGRDVEAWVEFAVKNKVKEVSLEFGWGRDVFTVPEMLYSSSSLTYLFLEKCLMAPLKAIEWQSLTELAIEDVKLDQDVVDKILLGCPVLHSLNLVRCWGFSCLKLDSPSLYKLMVSEAQREALLEISAPYLHCLNISLGRKLLLRNIPSLATAYINFNGCTCDQDATPMEMNNMKDFLEMTRHVKELELGVRCFQVVSTLVVSGWQLPQSRRVSLKLSVLRGYNCIISLLESSPNLETLEIRGYFNKYSRVESVSHDLDDDLVHLKRVKMYTFAAASIGGDPLMLTIAKILLKRATILEEMIILSDPNDITTELLKLGRPCLLIRDPLTKH